ncbi:MAG: hypothetical protein HWE30_01880 [Methylocystaceae bacterium]|nr:hypothetical protein [Methylocystaceae bacterium]
MPHASSLEDEIEKINDFVQTAQRLIHQNTLVDISLLHEKTQELCTLIQETPLKEAKSLLPRLENLFKSIERLEMDLNMQHDAISEHIKTSPGQANPLFAQEVAHDDDED